MNPSHLFTFSQKSIAGINQRLHLPTNRHSCSITITMSMTLAQPETKTKN